MFVVLMFIFRLLFCMTQHVHTQPVLTIASNTVSMPNIAPSAAWDTIVVPEIAFVPVDVHDDVGVIVGLLVAEFEDVGNVIVLLQLLLSLRYVRIGSIIDLLHFSYTVTLPSQFWSVRLVSARHVTEHNFSSQLFFPAFLAAGWSWTIPLYLHIMLHRPRCNNNMSSSNRTVVFILSYTSFRLWPETNVAQALII